MLLFQGMNKQGLVSIIITTKNEEEVLGKLLESIRNQTYKKVEIILVDNNSIDATVEIAKKFDVTTYTFGPERSAQRNFGVKKARGKYLFFLDADMELTTGVIEECIEAINYKNKIPGIAVPEVSIAKNFWERVKAFERTFYNEKGDVTTDAARFFLKEIFVKVGGYDEKITGPEDWDLPENIMELGYHIGRIKSVIYHRERIISIFNLAKKKYYYALKTHRYLKKHNIRAISAKTIFFLRPIFYKNWRKIIFHPLLSLCLIFMLTIELIAGGVGYTIGRLTNR